MSWVRWGGFCTFLGQPWLRWCHGKDEICEGSSVYVFGTGDDLVECCDCELDPEAARGISEEAMVVHLKRHHDAGHHVPLILFEEETIARADAFWKAMTVAQRINWQLAGYANGEALWKARIDAMVRATR